MKRRLKGAAALAVTITLAFGPAAAQTGRPAASAPAATPAKPSAAPVPAEPGVTTASYGDWVMRCQRAEEAGRPLRICEVAQTVQVQGQSQPIAQIAIGRLSARDPLEVTVLLPPNVSLPSSVYLQADDKDVPGFEMGWRRCMPGSCVAQAPAREDLVKRWRGATEAGRIAFKNAAGQDVAVPVTFRGLGPALDALAREPA